jgi:hypothetical protein
MYQTRQLKSDMVNRGGTEERHGKAGEQINYRIDYLKQLFHNASPPFEFCICTNV